MEAQSKRIVHYGFILEQIDEIVRVKELGVVGRGVLALYALKKETIVDQIEKLDPLSIQRGIGKIGDVTLSHCLDKFCEEGLNVLEVLSDVKNEEDLFSLYQELNKLVLKKTQQGSLPMSKGNLS